MWLTIPGYDWSKNFHRFLNSRKKPHVLIQNSHSRTICSYLDGFPGHSTCWHSRICVMTTIPKPFLNHRSNFWNSFLSRNKCEPNPCALKLCIVQVALSLQLITVKLNIMRVSDLDNIHRVNVLTQWFKQVIWITTCALKVWMFMEQTNQSYYCRGR